MMDHSQIAIQTAEGSTWNLDRFAENLGWDGVGIVFTHHRDSDPFNKSNWDVIFQRVYDKFSIGPELALPDISLAYFNHWLVGWMEHMCFNTARQDIAEYVNDMHKQLQNYPLLDEIHYMDNYADEDEDE